VALPREGCVVAGRTVAGTVDAAATEDTAALSGDLLDAHETTQAPPNNIEITCRHTRPDCPVRMGGVELGVRSAFGVGGFVMLDSANSGRVTSRSGGRLEVLLQQLLGHGFLPETWLLPLN